MSSVTIKPFTLAVPDSDLADLERRLNSIRWPEKETVSDWSQGVPLRAIKELCQYWKDNYDWRRCERWLNSNGHHMATIDGYDIQFLHIKSTSPAAIPVLMLHGWPGSVIEFNKVIGPLVDPLSHGGSLNDAFHLVLPSMPGYGFSSKPETTGTNHRRMGEIYTTLMESLGYDNWVAQGGDWGADICAKLASQDPPKSLKAVHMSTMFFDAAKEFNRSPNPSREEQVALDMERVWQSSETGYFKLQATRPQTIGYSLADSPSGQAAWIYEKLYVWSDNAGDLSKVFSMDEILDNIMLYWLSNSGASSARLYWEDDDNTGLPIMIPVGVTIFPKEPTRGPRKWGERYYENIIHWNETKHGGHFAAWEVPKIFVEEVRTCFKHVRA